MHPRAGADAARPRQRQSATAAPTCIKGRALPPLKGEPETKAETDAKGVVVPSKTDAADAEDGDGVAKAVPQVA